MYEKRKVGSVILVEGLCFRDANGEISEDLHGNFGGRPCIIVGEYYGSYIVCPITTNTQILEGTINRFQILSDMIIPTENYICEKDKQKYVKTNRFCQITCYDNYNWIYSIDELSYLSLLENILEIYKDINIEDFLSKTKLLILFNIKTQSIELKRKLNI